MKPLGALVLCIAALVGTPAPSAAQAVTWQLGQPNWKNQKPPVNTVRLDDIQLNAVGGHARITGLHDGECSPGAGMPPPGGGGQRFLFRWFFDRDVSQLRFGQDVTVRFTVEGDWSPCMQLNPIMALKGEVNHLQFLGGDRFYAFPNQVAPGFHAGGSRTIKVWRQDAIYQQSYFIINIYGFRGNRPFDLDVIYPYTVVRGQSQGLPAAQFAQDMGARARSDARFGGPVPGASVQVNLNWAPAYELRWLEFQFAGGQRITIYHATEKANPSRRWTIYYDPQAGRWLAWVPAS